MDKEVKKIGHAPTVRKKSPKKMTMIQHQRKKDVDLKAK